LIDLLLLASLLGKVFQAIQEIVSKKRKIEVGQNKKGTLFSFQYQIRQFDLHQKQYAQVSRYLSEAQMNS